MRALFSINLAAELTDVEILARLDTMRLKPTGRPDGQSELLPWFQNQAEPILKRMPTNADDDEDKRKKERVLAAIRYWSLLPLTGTQFMMAREIEGVLTFRLINDKIEFLQEGCEELLERLGVVRRPWKLFRDGKLSQAWKMWNAPRDFELAGRIEIYEHGLESSTIRGSAVRKRLRYAMKHSGKDLVIGGGAALVFLALIALEFSGRVEKASEMAGHLDRLGTAMLTTFIISAYSIAHTYFAATPPVQWTVHYEKE